MNELRDDHAVQTTEGVVGNEDKRSVIRRNVLYAVDGGTAPQFFAYREADELIVACIGMTTQESVHLLDMRDALQVPKDELRYMRLRRFALDNRPYVELKRHY